MENESNITQQKMNLNDLTHQDEIKVLKNLINKNEKIIIYGHYGIGKTLSVYLLADELNYEVLELNPSNITKETIQDLLKSSEQQSLFQKGKILLIDEADNISKRNITEIQKIIENTNFSAILTVNDIENPNLSSIKKKLKIIKYRKPTYQEITNILENICKKENINYSTEDIEKISRLSNNDIRAAINDLKISINNKALEINLNYRDTEQNILSALTVIFKTKDLKLASQAFNNVSLDLNECTAWIDENLPLEYNKLANAYELLSKAALYEARIRKRQHYRLLYYQNMLTTGIALAKDEKNNKVINYKRPSRFLKIYISNRKNHYKNTISTKIAKKTHSSHKETVKDFPLLKEILKNNNYNDLNLTEEEIIFLKT